MREVITFFGAEPKVGTTMVAQSVAEELLNAGYKTLLIFASSELYDAYLNTESNETSIDDLRELERLEPKDISRVIKTVSGLDYIKGVVKPFKIRYFNPNILPELIEVVRNKYDYIVIDGGSNYQYPLPISALLAADRRFFVVTQNPKAVLKLNNLMETLLASPVFKKKKTKDELIVNKHAKDGVYSTDNIQKLLNLNASVVSNVPGSASCEATKQTLNKINKTYRANISDITKKILGEV